MKLLFTLYLVCTNSKFGIISHSTPSTSDNMLPTPSSDSASNNNLSEGDLEVDQLSSVSTEGDFIIEPENYDINPLLQREAIIFNQREILPSILVQQTKYRILIFQRKILPILMFQRELSNPMALLCPHLIRN